MRFGNRSSLLIPASALVGAKALPGHELVGPPSLGMVAEVAGGAFGYNQAGDIITKTVDGRPLTDLWNDYQAALLMYNSLRDPLLAVLSFDVTKVIEDVFQGGDTVDFEEASEFGLPRAVRPAPPTYFSLAYSFKWYDIAARFTWKYLADAPSDQIDTLNNQIMEADNRNVFDKVMRAIFNNTTRAATISGQNYNVYPLYNGDSTVPPPYKLTTFTAPHTHYLMSGASTLNSGDLTGVGSIEEHLSHHGYGWAQGTAMILFANSAETAVIRTFARDNTPADTYDFIQAISSPLWALNPQDINLATGGQSQAAPPSSWQGMNVIGRYGPWLVVEEDLIPAGYLLGVASGGEGDIRNLVGIRQHVNAALRGLRLVKGPDPDYPLIDSAYQHGFGTGIRQRGGAVVMKLGTGSYTPPTAYATP